MKAIAIFFVVALLITLDSCGDTSITPPSHTTATIDTIQDLYRLDSALAGAFMDSRQDLIIQDNSVYQALYQEAVTTHSIRQGASFPFVNFITRTVIGMGDEGERMAGYNGGVTTTKFLMIRNDSTQTYTCISRFIYPDNQPRSSEGFYFVSHLFSVPKLLPQYRVIFVRDTI